MAATAKEIELLKRCLKGDTKAFEVIVSNYQELVCAITYSGVADIHRSEELAQQAFINAWNKLSQLKDLSKFRPWLCTIARNLVKSFIRTKKRDIIAKAKTMENINDTAADESGPLESIIKKEHEELVSDAIQHIPEKYREPLVLYYRQRLSVRQIAESLDLSEGNAKKRLQRGRKMVKEQLNSIFEETLSTTGPKKAFTTAVVASVAGIVLNGTGVAAAATVTTTGGTATTTGASITAIMSTVTAKVITAVAVVIATAAVSIYSYNVSKQQPEDGPAKPVAQLMQNNDSRADQESQAANADGNISKQNASGLNRSNLVKAESETVIKKEDVALHSSRHSNWPTLQEPVQSFYMRIQGSQQIWIHLPREFRHETENEIVIDNGKERLEVKKDKGTIQYSETLNSGDKPVGRYGSSLNEGQVQLAYLFGRPDNPIADSNFKPDYTVEQIAQEDNGSLLIFKLSRGGNEVSDIEIKSYVDAATLLPEKIVTINNDPNSGSNGQVQDILNFGFSPIPESMFNYTVKADQKVLPFKQEPCFRGKVVDTMDNPIAGADIFVHYFPLYGKDYMTGKSDADGNFEIKLSKKPGMDTVFLPVYFWATIADDPNFAAWTILHRGDSLDLDDVEGLIPGYGGDIIQSDSEPQIVTRTTNGVKTRIECVNKIQKKAVISNIRLVMEPTGTIGGFVTDKKGNAIADAKLSAGFLAVNNQNHLGSFRNSDRNWKFSAVSDSTGYYEFNTLPAFRKGCQYWITISAPGFVSETKGFKTEKPLDIKAFDIALNLQLVTICGVLKDNHGVPLANRRISLSAPNIDVKDCSARTDPNGIFVMEGCPDVAGLKVRSSLSMDYPVGGLGASKKKWDAFLFYPDISQEISYVAGQHEYFVEMIAIQPETKVDVLLIDSAGNSLSEFKVKVDGFLKRDNKRKGPRAWGPWSNMKLEKRTDKKGKVTFDNIPDLGNMNIIVSANMHFSKEDYYGLQGKPKERVRLNKVDQVYREKYQEIKIPVKLVEGQTSYSVEVVVLTKDEFKNLSDETQ